MKRYLTFAYHHYEALGGMYDFKGDYDTFPEAKKALESVHRDNKDIYDTKTKRLYNVYTRKTS